MRPEQGRDKSARHKKSAPAGNVAAQFIERSVGFSGAGPDGHRNSEADYRDQNGVFPKNRLQQTAMTKMCPTT